MLKAGEGLLANGSPQRDFSFRLVDYPLGLKSNLYGALRQVWTWRWASRP